MRLFIATLLLCLPACVERGWEDVPGAEVHATAPHAPEQLESWSAEVPTAIAGWNDGLVALGCPAPFVMSDRGHAIELIPVDHWDHGTNIGGMTYPLGGIEIRADLIVQVRHTLLVHELGHAIGLGHADPEQGDSIMQGIPIGLTLQDRDLEAAACHLGCGPCDAADPYDS